MGKCGSHTLFHDGPTSNPGTERKRRHLVRSGKLSRGLNSEPVALNIRVEGYEPSPACGSICTFERADAIARGGYGKRSLDKPDGNVRASALKTLRNLFKRSI